MRTQVKFSIVAATLGAALLSSALLSHAWHLAVIEGRVFSGILGTEFTALALASAVPLLWPFLVAGLLLGLRTSRGSDLIWAVGLGIAGALLHLLLSGVEFAPGAEVAQRLSYYAVVPTPLVLSIIGFYASRIFRTESNS